MKFKNIFLMVCIFFMGFAYSNKYFLSGPMIYDDYLFRRTPLVRSIFQIIIENNVEEKKKQSLGMIFYIGDNRFVTNAHVLLGVISPSATPSLYFDYRNRRHNFSKLLALDQSNDLAILKLREEDFKQVEKYLIPLEIVATAKMPSHLKGVSYGFTELLDTNITKKITFKGYESVEIDPHTIQLISNINITDGMSGSPVVIQGKVIGVLNRSWNNLFFATKSDALISLLERPFINKDFNDLSSEILSWINYNLKFSEFFKRLFYLIPAKLIAKLYVKMGQGEKLLKILKTKPSNSFMYSYEYYGFAKIFFQNGDTQRGLESSLHLNNKGFNIVNWDIAKGFFEEGHEWSSEVKRYFKRAALRGFGPSSYVMGMDAEARGSFEEAASWFAKSFYQGYIPAFFKLKDLYREHNLKMSSIHHTSTKLFMRVVSFSQDAINMRK